MENTLRYAVIRGKVLGVDVYRGFGKLSDLSKISEADIFDQKTNPLGTQRDLSPQHAKAAYLYVKEKTLAFWPEVFLCVRNHRVITFVSNKSFPEFGILEIKYSEIKKLKEICISRVDGNHRLHFASGEHAGFPEINENVSFCLAYNLELDQEIRLFRDINDNQRKMNTSHLDNIEVRLSSESQLKKNPSLFIAKKLNIDKESPFFEKILEGGRKPGYFTIPLRSLKTGIQYLFTQTTKLTELPDVDVQYIVIRNYFNAVKKWQPNAWKEPKKYFLLRGVGLWAVCLIGASVIDKTLSNGKYSISDMFKILSSGKTWDWTSNGNFVGYSGQSGAKKIKDIIVSEFTDKNGISIKSLAEKILKDNG